MLAKSFFSAILSFLLLLAISSNALAFDASVFKSLNKNSVKNAKAFLALSQAEAYKLALEHVQLKGKRQTNYMWQVFLLAYLSNQEHSLEQWKLIESNSLIADLDDGWDYKQIREIEKNLAKQDDEKGEMCFTVLQIIPSPKENKNLIKELQDQKSDQGDILRNIQKSCVFQLLEIINREDVFNWFIDSVEKEKYGDQILALFKQSSFTKRMIFKEKQGVSFDVLNDKQQQRLVDAWVPYFIGEKESSLLRPYTLSNTIESNEDDEFVNKFMQALKAELSENKPEEEKLIDVLEGIVRIESKSSSELFLNLAWKTPLYKDDFRVFEKALEEGYNSDSRDKNFPAALHQAATNLIVDDKDIRFADAYMNMMFNAEGGQWNEDHEELLKTIPKIAPKLADDTETQGVLKHAYLSAAAIEYFIEQKHLKETKDWLDKAETIKVPAVSWYSHLMGEKSDFPELNPYFIDVKKLHENNQLSELSDWVEKKKKPTKSLVHLPLSLYEMFTGEITESRVWHDSENGQAIILDYDGNLHYFDGYEVVAPKKDQLKVTRMLPGGSVEQEATEPSGSVPKITSSLDQWIGYAIGSLFDGSNTNEAAELAGNGIDSFANNNQAAEERLLFAKLEEGNLESFPDYLEYSRYKNQIMLSADVYSEINQYLITLANEAIAIQWMEQLKNKAPIEHQNAELWYKATGSLDNDDHGIMMREYVSENDDNKVITALLPKAGFEYTTDACVEFKGSELKKNKEEVNKKILELYKRGYLLSRIYHDEGCVEKSNKAIKKDKESAEVEDNQ